MIAQEKIQEEFERKRLDFSKYLKSNDIVIPEQDLGKKYKSFLRLKEDGNVNYQNYLSLVDILKKRSEKKSNAKLSSEILRKFEITQRLNRNEIITFEFKDAQDFINYIDHGWEQDQENDNFDYKKRFLNKIESFKKKYFVNETYEVSLLPKCEEKYQRNDEYKKVIEDICLQVSAGFRYMNSSWSLAGRAFLERNIKDKIKYLLNEKVKISIGNKLCPQPIKLKDGEIYLKTKFIWILKFGDPVKVEINNLYEESEIFQNFIDLYLLSEKR